MSSVSSVPASVRLQMLRGSALLLFLLGVVACARPASQEDNPSGVVERFILARQDKNLEATMATFGDSPEIRSSLGVGWSGRDAVRAVMAYRLADAYTVGARRVVGNHVVWTEHVRRTATRSPVANFDEDVEATVVGGRISTLVTYVGGAHPPPLEPSNQVSASGDVLAPLGTLVLVAAAVLVWPQAPAVQPRRVANGHLLQGLREYVARRG